LCLELHREQRAERKAQRNPPDPGLVEAA
jgi:hypothetical protein